MNGKFVFMAYPVPLSKTLHKPWAVDYLISSNYQLMSAIQPTPAQGILELLPKITEPNNAVFRASELPPGEHVYEFECEQMGAFIFTTLAIDGKLEYSTVDESAAYGRWELANALLEDEVKNGT